MKNSILFRIFLTEFLKSFHQFTETQQYLIDVTFSTIMHNNEVDDICGDLLSELSIEHDKGENMDFFFRFNTFISL